MKNSIRCCISCILPCGALDVIRIVHSNGRVEEITHTIRACEIMKSHPKHVLKKPSSSSSSTNNNTYSDDADHNSPRIVTVPPDDELRRGKIYFLVPIPNSSAPEKARRSTKKTKIENRSTKIKRDDLEVSPTEKLLSSDRYLSEILAEKLSSHRDRRRGRVAVWRPHLESICESPCDM